MVLTVLTVLLGQLLYQNNIFMAGDNDVIREKTYFQLNWK